MPVVRESTRRVTRLVIKELFSEKGDFSCEERVMTFHRVKIWKIRKIWKTWSMTKKVVRNLRRENGKLFLKTVIQKSSFRLPQTRRLYASDLLANYIVCKSHPILKETERKPGITSRRDYLRRVNRKCTLTIGPTW